MSMKKKLRTLRVDNSEYLYSIGGTYIADTEESIFIMRIFVDKYSKYALFVHFRVLDDYYVGNPLNHGVLLYNTALEKKIVVNLNRPLFIRLALDYGLEQGWRPTQERLELDGLDLLVQHGYQIDKLLKKTYSK
ncbi:hypothetical protein HX045_03285 [Myroides odoratimimus]|nr:hypothetical protein [Myroides odoratimimus]MDM1468238.1 hypothetical protein [Myroides odoratimimus]MDM1471543.1 hypothetical protein [Myroides odoratimimus]MDM1481570.1 hypothetical protein [Myroides odoratimimus]MDM1482708.1 hypothetical protein [Myroides odoratimimus]